MPLEIIGAGFGRTGTKSLQTALQILGYPCHHMTEVFANNEYEFWGEAGYGMLCIAGNLLVSASTYFPLSFFYLAG